MPYAWLDDGDDGREPTPGRLTIRRLDCAEVEAAPEVEASTVMRIMSQEGVGPIGTGTSWQTWLLPQEGKPHGAVGNVS